MTILFPSYILTSSHAEDVLYLFSSTYPLVVREFPLHLQCSYL